tara:strand:+ start:54 stop:1109 length:1056 start_codon:yes stop_codon:yes gene_type:complete
MIKRFLRSALNRSLESKTLQSLEPLVDPKLHQVITSKHLSREILVELFSHRCAAVRIPNFYPEDMIPIMRDKLLTSSHRTNWKVTDPQRGLENSSVESIGIPLAMATTADHSDASTDEEDRMSKYFATSRDLTRSLRTGGIRDQKNSTPESSSSSSSSSSSYSSSSSSSSSATFSSSLVLTPIDKLRLELDEEWSGGARVGRHAKTGRPLLAGAGRIMYPTNRDDRGFCHVDDIAIMSDNHGVFSANVYLETPPQGCGGELHVWPLSIRNRMEFYNHSASLSLLLTQEKWAQEALRRCLPPPVSISPQPGELILICAQRPHAVVGFDVGRRISMQTFIESQGTKKSLLLES